METLNYPTCRTSAPVRSESTKTPGGYADVGNPCSACVSLVRPGLDSCKDRLQDQVPRDHERFRVGAPEAHRHLHCPHERVLVPVSRSRLQAPAHRRPVSVGLFRRGDKDRPRISSREGISLQQDSCAVMDCDRDVGRQSPDHPERVRCRATAVLVSVGTTALPGRSGPVRDVLPGPDAAGSRVLAGDERLVPQVPRLEPGVGRHHAGRVLS